MLARGVKARSLAGACGTRRSADNAGVDEPASRWREQFCDPQYRRRRDCVALHEDRFHRGAHQRSAKSLGDNYRLTRRDDRQYESALSYEDVVIVDDVEVRLANTCHARGAAALERSYYARTRFAESSSDRGAHLTRADNRDTLRTTILIAHVVI